MRSLLFQPAHEVFQLQPRLFQVLPVALDSSHQRLVGLLPSALVGYEDFTADRVVSLDRSDRRVVRHG